MKAQLAGDLMDPKIRYKMLPATGFLGLGPWYYDNGSNEVTRADERHDRVDAVTRGFMGLTVACARCHDHKYDPIPQTDYYASGRRLLQHHLRRVSGGPEKGGRRIQPACRTNSTRRNKILQEANQALSTELPALFAFQTANYICRASGKWPGRNRRRKSPRSWNPASSITKCSNGGSSTWRSPPTSTRTKPSLQAMMKKGSATPAQVKDACREVPGRSRGSDAGEVRYRRAEQGLADKDLDGTKPKKRTDKPSNFVSNKDFNPGALIRFKSLPDEMNNFYTEVFVRELKDSDDPNAMMAAEAVRAIRAYSLFRGWGLKARLGAEPQARIKTMQDDIDATARRWNAYPFIHGVMDSDKPVNIQLALRGNPETLGPRFRGTS